MTKWSICFYNCVGSGWNNVSLWFFAMHHEVLSPSRLWNLVLLYLVLPYSVDRRASIKCLDKLKFFWLVYNVCYNVSWTVVDFNFYPEKMHAPRQASCAFCPCWELDGILISAIKTTPRYIILKTFKGTTRSVNVLKRIGPAVNFKLLCFSACTGSARPNGFSTWAWWTAINI